MDLITTAISAIQLAIAAAPQVVDIVEKAKAFITSLFNAGLISKATQDAIHAHVDAYQAAALAGTPPPEFTVEADPQ